MHLGTVNLHSLQLTRDFLHTVFLAAEDDDALQVTILEQMLDDAQLLRVVTDVGRLLYLLCRLRYGQLDFNGVVE